VPLAAASGLVPPCPRVTVTTPPEQATLMISDPNGVLSVRYEKLAPSAAHSFAVSVPENDNTGEEDVIFSVRVTQMLSKNTIGMFSSFNSHKQVCK
jgi:hypothetical protein